MKLFRFYSTAEIKKNSDIIVNLDEHIFQYIRFCYNEQHKAFVIKFETNKAELTELHEHISFAKERAKIMLMQFDVPEKEAQEFADQARFLIV